MSLRNLRLNYSKPVPLWCFSLGNKRKRRIFVDPFMRVTAQMTRYLATLKETRLVVVTRTVNPRLSKFLHLDIQSTGQKSHCVNTFSRHRNALF